MTFSKHFTRNKVQILELFCPPIPFFRWFRTGREEDFLMIKLVVYFSRIVLCVLSSLDSRGKKQIVNKQINIYNKLCGGFIFFW